MTESRFQSIRNFYRSTKWKIARSIKIEQAKGLCEKCGRVGTEVHHIIHLTPENINDPNITINQDNLILLCNECHNKEHGRFEGARVNEFDVEGNFIGRKEKESPQGVDKNFSPKCR